MMEANSQTSSPIKQRLVRRRLEASKQSDEEDEGKINSSNMRTSFDNSRSIVNSTEEKERLASLRKIKDNTHVLQSSSSPFNHNNKNQSSKQNDGFNTNNNNNSGESEIPALGDVPMTSYSILEPTIRTDPIKEYQNRQRRLERIPAEGLPEIHFVGQIRSCTIDMTSDSSEGCSIRYKIDHGASLLHLEGNLTGQTHFGYCSSSGSDSSSDSVPLNHPLDIHMAQSGLQGWDSIRISVQSYKLDAYGRRILTGYGFVHLPMTAGYHSLDIDMWLPTGSAEVELERFLLGTSPALLTEKPIYRNAWQDRSRLVTRPAGTVLIDLYVVTRNYHHGQ